MIQTRRYFADLFLQSSAPNSAGVLGLSSALKLLGDLSQYHVVLVAAYFAADGPNPSYATTAAGAHYRPIPATTPQLKREAQLAHVTYDRFKSIATHHPEFGVQFLEGIEFVSEEATSAYKAILPDYVSIDGFRILGTDERPPGAEFGARYETYTVNPEVYTAHLLQRFQLRGGQVRRMKLGSVEEAFELARECVAMVVNCSGFGFADPNSFMIRGKCLFNGRTLHLCLLLRQGERPEPLTVMHISQAKHAWLQTPAAGPLPSSMPMVPGALLSLAHCREGP